MHAQKISTWAWKSVVWWVASQVHTSSSIREHVLYAVLLFLGCFASLRHSPGVNSCVLRGILTLHSSNLVTDLLWHREDAYWPLLILADSLPFDGRVLRDSLCVQISPHWPLSNYFSLSLNYECYHLPVTAVTPPFSSFAPVLGLHVETVYTSNYVLRVCVCVYIYIYRLFFFFQRN